MNEGNRFTTSPRPQDDHPGRLVDSPSHLFDVANRREHVFITQLHVMNVVSTLRRMPAGFYMDVEINGKTWRTSTKPILAGKDVVEWDEEILLPSDRSSIVSLRVFASLEVGSTLGKGEMVGEFKIPVGEVLDRNEQLKRITTQIYQVFPSCLSLRIIAERRVCNVNETTKRDLSETRSVSQLEKHTEEGQHAVLADVGRLLYQRFQDNGDLADIHGAISIFELAVQNTPNGHPSKLFLLVTLGNSLFSRFTCLNSLADLDRSISMKEQAVHLTPHDHSGKPSQLEDLGGALLRRFDRLGDIADLNKSISTQEEAIRLTPDDHPDKSNRLGNLGSTILHRFLRFDDLAALEKSVSFCEDAIRLSPDDHPDKPGLLSILGNSLLCRFQRYGDPTDFERTLSTLEQAVHLTPDDHPKKPNRLNNLGNALMDCFKRFHDLADINKSISMREQAVSLTPDGDVDKPRRLNNLGNSLLNRFELIGDFGDIDKSVRSLKEAVRLTPDDHPSKPGRLSNLGKALFLQFERVGGLPNIDKSIALNEDAVRLIPDDHPIKRSLLDSLGNSLSRRFDHLEDLADISMSISMKEEAVRLTPNNHPDKPRRLSNLATSLSLRFAFLGILADINKSISMNEEAVNLTADDHSDKPVWLNNFGASLYHRFERLGDAADIDKSISMIEEAIRLSPDNHPDKSTFLDTLGSSLCCRFQHLHNLTDIKKSILMLEEAVRLTLDGHPKKPARLNNLGHSLMASFEHSGDSSDLRAATLCFSSASRISAGPPSVRFRAVRRWISAAHFQGNSQTLLDAYTTAINLLPHLAWLGLLLRERHRVLVEAADLARDAAATALEAGCTEMAVEWLEQGRSVVWSQFLQLRTPVDELREKHPTLGHQFQEISQQLERAGFRDNLIVHRQVDHTVAEIRSLENEVQRHHELALRREKLLDEIRSLPGFDRFLLPKTLEELVIGVKSGPVVYLNASKHRCDALIIKSGSTSVIPVALPDVSYPVIEEMLCLLLQRSYPNVPHEVNQVLIEDSNWQHSLKMSSKEDCIEGYDREGGPVLEVEEYSFDDRFRRVLAFLWKSVVNPVLVALGFSAPSSSTEKMTRIFWCPTGPFSFLPIHAAGLYGTSQAGTKLSDFVISSYIPILGALVPYTGKEGKEPSSNIRIVTVPQPPDDGHFRLSGVKEEIDYIQTLSAKSRFVTLRHSDGSIEDVMVKMTNADWVHFACHGVQDPIIRLDSGLCLADRRRLKLSDIIRLSRPQGGLAFLSACQTAQGDENLSEESVHLAAGMLLAGYGSVIATMWSIVDRDAPRVARDVYEHLFRDEGKVPDSTEAAEALHHAVRRLRDSGVPFSSWVPFIHFGR